MADNVVPTDSSRAVKLVKKMKYVLAREYIREDV